MHLHIALYLFLISGAVGDALIHRRRACQSKNRSWPPQYQYDYTVSVSTDLASSTMPYQSYQASMIQSSRTINVKPSATSEGHSSCEAPLTTSSQVMETSSARSTYVHITSSQTSSSYMQPGSELSSSAPESGLGVATSSERYDSSSSTSVVLISSSPTFYLSSIHASSSAVSTASNAVTQSSSPSHFEVSSRTAKTSSSSSFYPRVLHYPHCLM